MMKVLKKKRKGGFTLIELIVVIAILGILAAILIPRMGGFTAKAQEAAALTHAKQFATAFDALRAEGKTWVDASPGATNFTTADVMTLASLDASHGAASNVNAAGQFRWTSAAAQGGKTAGRLADGPVIAPSPVAAP